MRRDYRKLGIWQKSYDFVLFVYPFLSSLPESEELNLVSQIRRAAVSIPLNIAEGSAQRSKKQFLHFLNISYASAKELDVCFFLCRDLFASDVDSLLSHLDDLKKMLFGFMRALEGEIVRDGARFPSFRPD